MHFSEHLAGCTHKVHKRGAWEPPRTHRRGTGTHSRNHATHRQRSPTRGCGAGLGCERAAGCLPLRAAHHQVHALHGPGGQSRGDMLSVGQAQPTRRWPLTLEAQGPGAHNSDRTKPRNSSGVGSQAPGRTVTATAPWGFCVPGPSGPNSAAPGTVGARPLPRLWVQLRQRVPGIQPLLCNLHPAPATQCLLATGPGTKSYPTRGKPNFSSRADLDAGLGSNLLQASKSCASHPHPHLASPIRGWFPRSANTQQTLNLGVRLAPHLFLFEPYCPPTPASPTPPVLPHGVCSFPWRGFAPHP